jgi:hypothetical protein
MVNSVARPLVSGLDLVRSKLMQDVIQERPRTVRPIQQLSCHFPCIDDKLRSINSCGNS